MRYIDALLNRITMYRLVLYYLTVLLVCACIEGAFGILSYNPLYLLFSLTLLIAVCWITNTICAYVWQVPTNTESVYITAFIIALIMTPAAPSMSFMALIGAGIVSQSSKYILTVRHKHLFNPVAIGVATVSFIFGTSASWWVAGTLYLMPMVLVGGLLIVHKLRRFDMVLTYIATAIVVGIIPTVLNNGNVPSFALRLLEHTPIFFFAFIMLTEPLTTPARAGARMWYGGIIATLATPWLHLGGVYFTPETALLVGNIFSYFTSSPFKKLATLKAINTLATDTYEYVFDAHAQFLPGQYAEWTLTTPLNDSRGNRRYFTLASSPTESDLRITVKMYEPKSAFKQSLHSLKIGDSVLVGNIAGDFILPKEEKQKLCFIAGGIGITPFRSQIQFLVDTHQKRDIVLLYSNRTQEEIAYDEILDNAAYVNKSFRVVHTLTDIFPMTSWMGERSRIDAKFIERVVPDYSERLFMISGPHAMVAGCKSELLSLKIPQSHILTDYFPGF